MRNKYLWFIAVLQASKTFMIHSSGTHSPNRSAVEHTKIVLPKPLVVGSFSRYSCRVGVNPYGYERIFYRIKFLLQRNKRGGVPTGQTYVRKNIHIFGGLLRCAQCGSSMISNQDRRRANGIRPSIYACGSRRRKQTSCTNKYISDIVLGPFVLNYIANLLRAARSYNRSISAEALSKRLLKDEVFSNVESINEDALVATIRSFEQASDAPEYRPQLALSGSNDAITEADTLMGKRRRVENALARLNALYLYDDEAMPEKDFVMQRADLSKQLDQINARLEELRANSPDSFAPGQDLSMKVSYFIMFEKLVQDSYVNYEKYIRTMDPAVPKSFLSSVIDHIDVEDGKVVSITFDNGVTHKFTYKE